MSATELRTTADQLMPSMLGAKVTLDMELVGMAAGVGGVNLTLSNGVQTMSMDFRSDHPITVTQEVGK